ncbi:MAG TPA: hypothetical protein VGJ56_18700 [Reyranella sp.]|jgi:hypothetical protein
MSTAFEIPEWLLTAPPPAPSADDHRIEGMVNHFIAGKQEALFTAPDAFYRLEGDDAIQGQPAINDRLQALRAATLDLARDDSERAALGPRLDLHIDDAADGIDRHVAGQRRVYQRQVVSQRQALIQRAAELEPDNDDKIMGLAEANATAAREGARMDGIAADSPEEAAAILGARSNILRRAIDERIANRKGAQALALFDQVKDQLSPADRLSLDTPVQAGRYEQAADQWIAREIKTDGPSLQERLDSASELPSDAKPIIRAKLDARQSADESARVAKVQALDDQVRSAVRILPVNPSAYRPCTFARLADAYDALGEPKRAASARRTAAQEAFIVLFSQLSVESQQQLINELPEGDLRGSAIDVQTRQAQAFAHDPFAAGTTLYKEVGPPAPIDDVEGRIRQARQLSYLRGISVVLPTTEKTQEPPTESDGPAAVQPTDATTDLEPLPRAGDPNLILVAGDDKERRPRLRGSANRPRSWSDEEVPGPKQLDPLAGSGGGGGFRPSRVQRSSPKSGEPAPKSVELNAREPGKLSPEESQRRRDLLEMNIERNNKHEQAIEDSLARKPSIIFRRQITVEPPGGPSTRMDFLTYDTVTGEYDYIEGKSTDKARLSPKQKESHPKIELEGSVIKGDGKPPFVGGLQLPAKKVTIMRPGDVD